MGMLGWVVFGFVILFGVGFVYYPDLAWKAMIVLLHYGYVAGVWILEHGVEAVGWILGRIAGA